METDITSCRTETPLDGGKTSLDDMNEIDTFVGGSYYTTLREATDGTLSDGRVRTHLHNLKGLGNHLYKTVSSPLSLRALSHK